MFSRGHLSIEVPSLYVRVYLLYLCGFEGLSCSLTVCEGVSIVQLPSISVTGIPSLYVMVYRSW